MSRGVALPSEMPSPPLAAGLRIVELDPERDSRWGEFVASHPDAVVYQHPAWSRVLRGEYPRRRTLCLGCEDAGGRLHGILPLAETRGVPLGVGGPGCCARLASLPGTPVAGPLSDGASATGQLLRGAVERAQVRPGSVVQIKVTGPRLDGFVEPVVGVHWSTTYVLDLPTNGPLRFGTSKNHSTIRWSVGKAERNGVRVRVADTVKDLRAWYPLYLEAMRHSAVPPRSYRLFAAMWQLLRPLGLMRLLVAECGTGGTPRMIAGSIVLMHGATAFYSFNGRSLKELWLRPNDLIQWRAIHDAHAEGFKRYDMGEVAPGDSGLVQFKTKWGASPQPLYRYHSPALPGPDTSGAGLPRRLGKAGWPLLPYRVTSIVGDRLYAFL